MVEMANYRISPDLDMHYQVDDFTDPWLRPQTILMLHGNAESGLAWYAWVPKLARHFRVVRPDMRGFGQSTAMPRDYPWSLDGLTDDFCELLDHLGVERCHLLGAKIGGTIARAVAARRPERFITLTVVGTPPPLRDRRRRTCARTDPRLRNAWRRVLGATEYGQPARQRVPTGRRRVVGQIHGAARRFRRKSASWARSPVPIFARTCRRCLPHPGHHDRAKRARLGRGNACLATAHSDSELLVLPGNSYHVAATHADRAAEATLDFIARRGGQMKQEERSNG